MNDYHAKFVAAVARGRGVSPAAVRAGFGKGGMVRAEQAVREGMADRVGTFDAVLGSAISAAGGGRRATAAGVDYAAEIARRKKLLMDDRIREMKKSVAEDKARLAALMATPPANTPPSSPPRRTRPADRTDEWDRRVACHEAGHAVTALARRVRVTKATIEPGTCLVQGRYEGATWEDSAPRSEDRLLVVLAGEEAERQHCGAGRMSAGDVAMAEAAYGGDASTWTRARDKVREILTNNFAAVAAVANALLSERTLTGDRIREVAGRIHLS